MAESLLIGAAADTAKGLAQLVAARALDEFKLASGFKDQLRKLNKKFENIQAYLEDAANSKYAQKSKRVKLWVQNVKDVAYLADDVMDEYAIEMFRREMEQQNRSSRKFREFFTHSNPISFRLQMAHKVNEILALFDEIDKEAKDIGLSPLDFTATSVTATSNDDHNLSQIRDYAAASSAEFVGRVKDERELLDFICSPLTEKHHLSTVAVVGMGGVGKTTFARRLSDHERICAHFGDNKIWVTVSENFEINKLLNMMLESVTTSNLELSSFDAIKRKLQEKLKGNKYFFVFDDVWNENENLWGSLKGLLTTIGISPGSVILTTTRSDDVATAADAIFKHKLEGLSTDESWSLFYQIVSNKKMEPIHYSLEEVGKRIVKKCGGVPLAIKVIGGLLRSKPSLHEWKSIEGSELWDLPHGHDHILPSLLLSFSHLSSPIKQCFSYFAIFDRGSYIEYKSELFCLWLAQGYLQNDRRKNMTLEEIGEEYLNILLNNSLVECVQTQRGSVGYKTHDLLYDLAVYVFGSELIKKAEDLSEEGSCRHLVINSTENTSTSYFPPEKALAKLRTLHLQRTTPGTMLIHTKYLRTLLICRTGKTEISSNIALLKHLRLLDVSDNLITTLPDSISKLYQLQTLILQRCKNMKKLPKVVNKLPNLRHILTTAPMFAWKGLQQLTSLQTLPSLALNGHEEDWSIDELGYLHHLRGEVHVLGLECVKDKENARKAEFAQKANVTKLKLSWVGGRDESSEGICDEDVLEGLEPHSNITSLEVLNFLSLRFPTWIMKMGVLTEGQSGNRTQLNDLTTVKLLNCSRCETLPNLGKLPLLKFLTLSGLDIEIIGIEFYGGDDLGMREVVSFKNLRELEIFKFRRLTTWRDPPKAAFPSLETLRIKYCSALESVPAFEFRSLRTLELEDLNSVESLDIIKYSSGLISLTMDWLPKIESLPQELANCTKLQTLIIYNFDKLACLPIGLEAVVNLQSLKVAHCATLNFLMDDFLHIRSSLCTLEINNCPSLRTIPSSLEECTMLNTLMIRKCPLIKGSHTNMSKLQRLWELRMSFRSVEQLRCVLESAKDLPLLRRLEIEGFKNEKEMKDYFSDMTPFLNLPSLTELILCGHPNIKRLPKQLGMLTRITELYIWGFDDLEESPSWICNLTSLRWLVIEECKNLKGLPSKEDMQHLIALKISNCPRLVGRYAKDEGSEWDNISHIRVINIDGKTIQDRDE